MISIYRIRTDLIKLMDLLTILVMGPMVPLLLPKSMMDIN